jgi:hypothetical protein
MRPSPSQSIITGSCTSGSAATSSTRYPGASENRVSASAGGNGGESSGTCCTPGGHGLVCAA